MQQLGCESHSVTCVSCYVHVYGNKVIIIMWYEHVTVFSPSGASCCIRHGQFCCCTYDDVHNPDMLLGDTDVETVVNSLHMFLSVRSGPNKRILYCKTPIFIRYLNRQDLWFHYQLAVIEGIYMYVLDIHAMFHFETGNVAKLYGIFY